MKQIGAKGIYKEMKKIENRNFDKDQIVSALVKMRIEKFATTKTMLDFLMNDLDYCQTRAYDYIKISKEKVSEIFKEEWELSFANAQARLEEMIEVTRNEKFRLEAQKELNKLLGLHRPQKIDITTDGSQIMPSEVVVKIINGTQIND
jgi:hypothetical protein